MNLSRLISERPFLLVACVGLVYVAFSVSLIGAILAAPVIYWLYKQFSYYDT